MSIPKPRGRSARPPANAEGRMSLREHLIELRSRLYRAAIGLVAGMGVSFFFYGPIFRILVEPYCSLPAKDRITFATGARDGCALIFTHPVDAFAIRLKVALLVGALISSPIWLYQLWAFITPGLHRNERKWALWFVGVSVALFAGGSFTAYLVLHKALQFLLQAVGNYAKAALDINQYLSFVSNVLLIFGASFEFPLVLVLLNLAGVLTYRRLRGWTRMAVFLIFVFAGVATPTQDPFTMLFLALPLCALYFAAMAFAFVHDRAKARKAATLPWAGISPDEVSPLPEAPEAPEDLDALR